MSARSTSGAALQVDGAIKVAGTNTRPAFVHTTTGGPSGNTAFNETTIDNALANDDPNAMVIVTHQYSGSYLPLAYGVYYSGTRWRIFLENAASTMPVGEKFNVLIIKQ